MDAGFQRLVLADFSLVDYYIYSFCSHAFLDKNRVIAEDLGHSTKEKRYYCFGLNQSGNVILTVRFTYRSGRIRIIGAGYWRKGKKIYEQNNSI